MSDSSDAIAIVGLGARLPGAPDARAWMRREAPALSAPPAGRWPHDPSVLGAPGLRGGYLADPDVTPQELVQEVVEAALPPRRGRTTLVLATLGLPTRELVDVVDARIREHLGQPTAHSREALVRTGRVPRAVAHALGLDAAHGLDAACASGLYALAHAARLLLAGSVDCAVAAGVQRSDAAYLGLGFHALQALSKGFEPRPLDERADGLVVAEGAAAITLKRLGDALRDGDEVYAVLRGWGLGNDGRKGNLLAPSPQGQGRALRRAWKHAGLDPQTLGFAELHATGTPVGDGVELQALQELVSGGRVVLGCSKALIGHGLTMAGLAGTLRAIGALRYARFPAARVERPRAELREAAALHTLDEDQPWDGLRRASVSAFGFGGTNAHVILDAFEDGDDHPALPHLVLPGVDIVAVAAAVGDARDEAVPAALAAEPQPAPDSVTRGLSETRRGWWCTEVRLDPSRYRIPPLELTEMLPQQLLALELCADALSRVDALRPEATGVVLGMAVDPAVAEVVVRWRLHGDPAADEVHPPLTASRVQGSLPNFLANRIASQLDLQGPGYVVFAEEDGGMCALEHAQAMLADQPELDAVVVGAVDVGAQPALDAGGPRIEGGCAWVVRRGVTRIDQLPARPLPGWAGAAHEMLARTLAMPLPPPTVWGRVVAVPHSLPALAASGWVGRWGEASLPAVRPGATRWQRLEASGQAVAAPSLRWSWRSPDRPSAPPTPAPAPTAPHRPAPRPVPSGALDGVHTLAQGLARQQARTAAVHASFLEQRARAHDELAGVARSLERALEGLTTGSPLPSLPAPVAAAPSGPRPVMGPRQLLAHAGGPLSEAFGAAYADLDRYEPRVRLPLPPLLLVDRVLAIEGERGELGPASIVTEHDLLPEAPWAGHDGHAPASIVVESGQADMLLASWLGVDEACRGERVYRLLDCDLDFRGPLPTAGTTLHHDIRIKSFARLGDTVLFYFEYDCTDLDGRDVLQMRNGCAGFFTPAELATPRGCDAGPGAHPAAAPVSALLAGGAGPRSEAQVAALRQRRHGEALDQPEADGSTLSLPDTDWCLVHRVTQLERSGPPHGLGMVVFEQVLRDDDWFNPCHFLGDPCMPGTLMFEGCLQAVQLWLLGQGLAAAFPTGRFEPLPERPAELRCRGQVVPGHSLLSYTAYVREADLDGPEPWAVADVVLHCDGVPVVRAEGVGVRVVGERVEVDAPTTRSEEPAVDAARVMEYSVGSVARAFGAQLAAWDAPDTRVARMPGPPYLTMSHVMAVEGQQGVVDFPRSVSIAYEVPEDDWYFQADGASIPFAYLLEIALQPCGWLTAWQGAGLDAELRFRNLGGELTLHHEVAPGAGTLVTTVTQTSVSIAGALQVQFFDLSVRLGDTLVLEGTTHFGYFDLAALSGQKGLGLPDREERHPALEPAVALADHPALPRADWRVIDHVVAARPDGGAHGLGFYAATSPVDVDTWFFTAHFFLDPVMPGSLGLEAILQLARWVHAERTGDVARLQVLATGEPVSWKYRGQVLPGNDRMEVELDVVSVDADHITVDGVIRSDGLPIYRLDGATLRRAPLPAVPPLVRPSRPSPVAALLDRFEVTGDQGHGVLRLDPAVHPWLDQHRPTVTAPALPLAFAAEIAAEAAQLLAPGRRVIGLPELDATAWIHTADGPVDLHIVAVRQGDEVAVSLAVHEDNPRYPKLSGLKVRMRAVVALGEAWHHAPAPLEVDAPDAHDAAAHYAGGFTFHGPVLQAMTALHTGSTGSLATLVTAPDTDVLGLDAAFVLDPRLLDAATHPMLSGSPEHWHPTLSPGTLAYPVRCEGLRLHGPRPEGQVTLRLRQRSESVDRLVFDVQLWSDRGVWCTFRWHEAIVPAGPFLGLAAPQRRQVLWDHVALPGVTVGRSTERGWQVAASDLVEPLPGSLVGQCCTERELRAYRDAADREAWAMARLAAKEAIRAHLRQRLGREVHPRHLELLAMRADRYVLLSSPALTAQEWVDHLGPTRWHLCVDATLDAAEAWLQPADDRGRPPFRGLAVPATR